MTCVPLPQKDLPVAFVTVSCRDVHAKKLVAKLPSHQDFSRCHTRDSVGRRSVSKQEVGYISFYVLFSEFCYPHYLQQRLVEPFHLSVALRPVRNSLLMVKRLKIVLCQWRPIISSQAVRKPMYVECGLHTLDRVRCIGFLHKNYFGPQGKVIDDYQEMTLPPPPCVRACVRACVPACMRTCVLACTRVCVFVTVLDGVSLYSILIIAAIR